MEISSEEIAEIWEASRSNWHWPQLPRPSIGPESHKGEFPFENYNLTLGRDVLSQGKLYLENLFDHLIVHYLFCPRSLETAGSLALSAVKSLKDPSLAKVMVNIFSDLVTDSFRLERSQEDEEKVILGWSRLSEQEISPLDEAILGFLARYWDAPLPRSDLPEVELLQRVFSPGVRQKSLWPRQCGQMARILEGLSPGILGRGTLRTSEVLNGYADLVPLAGLASGLEPELYQISLSALGLKGDLKRWYRDQSCWIEISCQGKFKESTYPSGLTRWRLTDPPHELDVSYSLSISPRLIPGITTFKRQSESCPVASPGEDVPDLLVTLDSSKSMEGHRMGTKTHKATLAAFKACQFAHSQGAEVAAINFSDKFLTQEWTRDLGAVEDVLIEYQCTRTHIPGRAVLDLASKRKGCLILCITDTHIQNLYTEWEHLKEASELGTFVLFCIDQERKDRQVEEALKSLGQAYYIDDLEDLVSLVIQAVEHSYS